MKKPYSYWNNFANVKGELLNFIDKQGTLGVMPTYEELKNAKQSSLAAAINKHGGCQAVVEQLGLAYAHKQHGYWEDFNNLKRELLAFIEEKGTIGVMPTQAELKNAERGGLSKAISKNGGYQAIAERLGLTYAKKQNGYWNDFTNVERELLMFIEEQGTAGVMPTKEELKKANCKGLPSAIEKYGGCQIVAEKLGLSYSRKRPGYWEDFANLKRELFAFIEKSGIPGVMPTQEELIEAGRKDLVNAIQKKHGGRQPVAEKLGLNLIYTAKPSGYWEEFTNLEGELLTFIEEYGKHGFIPTHEELTEAGRGNLSNPHSADLTRITRTFDVFPALKILRAYLFWF